MSQTTINVDELRDLLDREQPVTVLDVRRTRDRAEWAIPGSLHMDVYDALQAKEPHLFDQATLPTSKPVVTVCMAGVTSLTAAEQLRERGFDVRSLVGGMKGWSLAWNSAEVPLAEHAARVIQIRRTGKGCLSYLIGSSAEAVVIDPSVQAEVYVEMAGTHGWRITDVLETHVHADHLTRAQKLIELTGATLRLPDQQRVSFPFTPVHDGDVISVGSASLVALHSPGHTLESTSYLLDNQVLFSGDTLFLNSVGRPDLESGLQAAAQQAHVLYHSLQRLMQLSPDVVVLPGHVSQPIAFDHQPLSARLGEVRRAVPLLEQAEDAFVETIVARIPPTPPNYTRILEFNQAGEFPSGDPTEIEAGANRCAVM